MIRQGVALDDPLLSFYYFSKLITKFAGVPSNLRAQPEGRRKTV
jgi:hypothetical protein